MMQLLQLNFWLYPKNNFYNSKDRQRPKLANGELRCYTHCTNNSLEYESEGGREVLDLIKGTGVAIWVAVVGIVVVLAIAFVFAMTNGWFISKANSNIRHSIGYTTAANQRCAADIQQFNDAQHSYDLDKVANAQAAQDDQAHMKSDVADCRLAVQGMSNSEIDGSVSAFLAGIQ